jgi:hypothetical protein
MISVQNNGINPVPPNKQDTKTNVPVVIGSTLAGAAVAGAAAHRAFSYTQEGDVISTKLDRYTKQANGLKKESSFEKDGAKPPIQVDYIENGKLTKREINYPTGQKNSLDFDEEGNVTKGVKSLGDTSIEYRQFFERIREKDVFYSGNTRIEYEQKLDPGNGDRIASTEIKIANKNVPYSGYGHTHRSRNHEVWKPWVWDTDNLSTLSEEHRQKIATLAPEIGEIQARDLTQKVPIRYLGDIPLEPEVLSKNIPKTFEEVIPYLNAQRNKQVALWGIGVGVLVGGTAFLINRLTAKKPQTAPPQATP